MILIYYTNISGKIVRCHLPPKDWSADRLELAMRDYNKRGPDTVHLQEIKENSLTAYLFEQAQLRRKLPAEAIRDAIDALSDAHNALDYLATLVEGGEG